ncbi:MAG: DUF2490 domain-containing protein [Deltaproteobacteria bacterium]|nr:DUF2490 domain-containing protein [Deltaproteobacteria bacterium]
MWATACGLEQRIIEDPSEVIVRLRYRLGLTFPLSDKWYVTGSNEVFVNFNDKETGPLDGFERNWLRGLVGYQFNRHLKLELGYHWAYLRRRGIPDLNQHALMLNIPISTR